MDSVPGAEALCVNDLFKLQSPHVPRSVVRVRLRLMDGRRGTMSRLIPPPRAMSASMMPAIRFLSWSDELFTEGKM